MLKAEIGFMVKLNYNTELILKILSFKCMFFGGNAILSPCY